MDVAIQYMHRDRRLQSAACCESRAEDSSAIIESKTKLHEQPEGIDFLIAGTPR